jgi:hypothetical protein
LPFAARAQQGNRERRIGVLLGLDENDPQRNARTAPGGARAMTAVPLDAHLFDHLVGAKQDRLRHRKADPKYRSLRTRKRMGMSHPIRRIKA